MQRPIGVTLLAVGAALAGLWELWRMLVFLSIASFPAINEGQQNLQFQNPQWGQALWALLLAAIWFWVAAGFWNVRAYAWTFGIFISMFTVIFGFFALLTSAGTMESETVGWLLAIAIFFYLNYPGVRNHFVEHEMSMLTPEQRAAMEQVAAANAAAAQAMAAPAAPMAAPAPTMGPPPAAPPSMPPPAPPMPPATPPSEPEG